MFHQVIRATIAALVLLPVYAHAGPIIVYQTVEARYRVSVVTVDNTVTPQDNDSEFFETQRESDPQDVVANAVLDGGRASSTVGLSIDLDESNNTFSIDASIAAISDPSDDIFARVNVEIRTFIDFMVESDTDDLVELVFSVDGSMPGLETVSADILAGGSARLNLGSSLGGRTRLGGFDLGSSLGIQGLTLNNTEVSGAESFLVRPGELYSLLTVVAIVNTGRDPLGLGRTIHFDAVGNIQLASSLQVQSVPEPWSLAMLGFGLLSIGWRRTRGLNSRAPG